MNINWYPRIFDHPFSEGADNFELFLAFWNINKPQFPDRKLVITFNKSFNQFRRITGPAAYRDNFDTVHTTAASSLKSIIFGNRLEPVCTFLRRPLFCFQINREEAIPIFIRVHPRPVIHERPEMIAFDLAPFLNGLMQPFQMFPDERNPIVVLNLAILDKTGFVLDAHTIFGNKGWDISVVLL